MPSTDINSRGPRVESVYLGYAAEEGGQPDQQTSTSSSNMAVDHDNDEAPFRRPLNLGIATAAANRAALQARTGQQQQQSDVASSPLSSPNERNNGLSSSSSSNPPSRVQQRLRAGHVSPSAMTSPVSPLPSPTGNMVVSQQQQQQQRHQQRPSPTQQYRMAPQQQHQQRGPPQMRPLELRGGNGQQQLPQARAQGQSYPQPQQLLQQQQRQNRPAIPVLQVTVPPPAHYAAANQAYQEPPRSPFSSSTETLVGSPLAMQKQKQQESAQMHAQMLAQKGAGNWSPNSSAGSAHNPHQPFHHQQQQHLGMPPPSPSLRNLQLQIPTRAADLSADSENDRLSPAMPRLGGGANNQKDWWKRFSTVVHQNEEREAMAEKVGGGKSKANAKAQSEWLDKQSHRQRNYRIWVGVVAVLILAGIGGGLAYHFVTKEKDAAEVQPTTHDFGLGTSTKDDTPSSTAAAGSDSGATSSISVMPQASAVPAGNHLSSIAQRGLAKRRDNSYAAATLPHDPQEGSLAIPVATAGLPRSSAVVAHSHAQRRRGLANID